jgi:hypothetical protein
MAGICCLNVDFLGVVGGCPAAKVFLVDSGTSLSLQISSTCKQNRQKKQAAKI